MGDVLSFIHLSTYLRSTLYAVAGTTSYKPIGQSVGDDLVLLGVPKHLARRFNSHIEKTGGKASKFNSSSEDSMTFCENFAVKPVDSQELQFYKRSSVFGDLFFLDTIKGSLLSGKSKVKSSGSDPFFGHARMLNKQTEWHPIKWVRERAGQLLWCRNYPKASKLSSSMASLPASLGGIDLQIGTVVRYDDESFQKHYLPYFEALAQLKDKRAFITFATMLKGIYQANPKGIRYDNDVDSIESVVGNLNLIEVRDINDLMPDFLVEKPIRERLRFLSKTLNLVGVDWLVDQVARREAFLRLWQGPGRAPYMTLPLSNVRYRHHCVWKEIRRSINPILPSRYKSTSIPSLKTMFDNRFWNVYFDKSDVAFELAFGGMPDLTLAF